ncbi:MAG: hypothetical protein OEZ65_16465 [Gemmatimonadota bacterium]|nr:hypothetical protein [Gemmatimonadota bacterium]MDH5761158.1 hypothetical protein [Gemmatimonadota bacterium]
MPSGHSILSVIHPVTDLAAAADLLGNALGFTEQSREEGMVVMDSGAVAVRLVQARGEDAADRVLDLEIVVADLELAVREYAGLGGKPVGRPETVLPHRVEFPISFEHGIRVIAVRNFTEDELGVVVPLPVTMEWTEEAEVRVQRILSNVPLAFRHRSRATMTRAAEEHATAEGQSLVEEAAAIHAAVSCTPAFDLPRLREALTEDGVDPEPFFFAVFGEAGPPTVTRS